MRGACVGLLRGDCRRLRSDGKSKLPGTHRWITLACMTDHAKDEMEHARVRSASKHTLGRRLQMWVDRQLHSLRTAADIARDKRITGVSLEENIVSPFAQSHGAIDTIHTPYGTLDVVLGKERFDASDVILDVGCGLGRPLAYLVDAGFPGKIVGAEINPPVAARAAAWAARYSNVEVICSDVFLVDFARFTHFFMWRPFDPAAFERFVVKLEREATRPVRVYYLSDTHTGDLLEGRAGWTIARRAWVHRVHGIPQHGTPERYTVWDFSSAASGNAD